MKCQDHQDDETKGNGQRLRHFIDRVINEGGGVVRNIQLHPRGQQFCQLGQGRANDRSDIHRAGLRLLHDAQPNCRLPVIPRHASLIGGADRYLRHVAQPNEVVLFLGNNDRSELLGFGKLAAGADSKFPLPPLDSSAWNFRIFTSDRRFNILRCETVTGHSKGIKPDAHCVAPLASDNHRSNSGQTLAWTLASTFDIMGSSISLGRLPRMRETLSRTSFAASSTFRFNSNSIVMTEPCSRLDEVSVFTPSSVANCSSSTLVICVSTTLGLAPR